MSNRTKKKAEDLKKKYSKIKVLDWGKRPSVCDIVINTTSIGLTENEKINMKSLNFDTNDGVFEGEIMLYVYDKSHLEKLIKKLRNINGIEKVVRIE